MTNRPFLCTASLLLLVLVTVAFAKSTTQVGQADAQVLAQSLLPAAQTAASSGSDTQLLRWLGISATPVGGGSTNEGTNMGVSGSLTSLFSFSISPHCQQGYTEHTTGLSGIPITYVCAPTDSHAIQLAACMKAMQMKPCHASDFKTLTLPLNNQKIQAIGASWWGHCDNRGVCDGGMQVSEQTVTNSDDITADADSAALQSPIYHTIKTGYSGTVTSQMQQIAQGRDLVNFKACAAGVTDTIINGIYHSCDTQNEGTFSGCKKVTQCTHYETTTQNSVSTKTCQLIARPQQKTCTKTLRVTIAKPSKTTRSITIHASAYTNTYKQAEQYAVNLQTGKVVYLTNGHQMFAKVIGSFPKHVNCHANPINYVGSRNWRPTQSGTFDNHAALTITQQPSCQNDFVVNFTMMPSMWYSYQGKALVFQVTSLSKPTTTDSWVIHCDGEVV